MSLINQMLQDLERRQGAQPKSGSLPGAVRAVNEAEKGRRKILWLAAAALPVMALAALAAWLYWGQAKPVAQKKNAVVAASPVVPPAPKQAVAPSPPLPQAEAPAPDAALKLPAGSLPAAKPADSQPLKQDKPSTSSPGLAVHTETDGHSASRVVARKKTVPSRNSAANPPKAQHAENSVATPSAKQVSPLQRAEFLYQKALGFLQQGRMSEAQNDLREALQLMPAYHAARQVLAGIMLENKRYDEAEHLLREGVALAPEEPAFAMVLARLQVERGDVGGALGTLEKGLSEARENAGYQSFLAALQQRQGKHRQAIEHYQAALRLSPDSPSALVGLGISMQAENRLAEAREAFGRARSSGGLSPELQEFVEQRLKQIQPLH